VRAFDTSAPSMRLWHTLLARGVTADEVTALMNDYSHELADRQRGRAASMHNQDLADGVRHGADLIDPEVQT
jgi:hypothetical protein